MLGQFEFERQVKRVEPVVTDVSKEANKSTKRLSTDDIEVKIKGIESERFFFINSCYIV